MEGAAWPRARSPDLAALARVHVRHPDRPGLGGKALRTGETMARGNAHEGDPRGIGRPDRVDVGVDAGLQEAQALSRERVYPDEAVIGPAIDKGQRGAVRRPRQAAALPPRVNELRGFVVFSEAQRPDLILVQIGD